MFLVWTLDEENICEVYAYIDNGNVIAYVFDGGDELVVPSSCESLFDTRQEAKEYISNLGNTLKEKAKEVCTLLRSIASWEDKYEQGATVVELCDFIPYSVRHIYEKKIEDELSKSMLTLARCARSRVLELGGTSIPMENISHVEWQPHGVVTVVLKSGIRVSAKERADVKVLEMLYDHKNRML